MRIEQVHSSLVGRLRSRREEIERAILARVRAVSAPATSSDPEYVHGLRATVSAAVDHGFAALEANGDRIPPIPVVLLTQARLAAREGISLDTVLRRYLAGYTLLGDFLIQEAEATAQFRGQSLQRLLRSQAALFDRLLSAVSEEYSREEHGRPESGDQRRADRVKRLLAGELVDTSDLDYVLGEHHLGMIASGEQVVEALGLLAKTIDRRLLLVPHEQNAAWAWLGGRRCFEAEEMGEVIAHARRTGITAAVGEPGQGVSGWRNTHHQARAALLVARAGPCRVVRYADVALLASMLRDDLLVSSLRDLYLAPLEEESDGGSVARETLQAYFAAQRNASSAAATLGVTRRTVSNRLRAIERLFERSLPEVALEVEATLRLGELIDEDVALPTVNTSGGGVYAH